MTKSFSGAEFELPADDANATRPMSVQDAAALRSDNVSSSDGDDGKPEPHDYGGMGIRQRLMRAETLFGGSFKPLRSLVPCTPREAQVCSYASTAERRNWPTT